MPRATDIRILGVELRLLPVTTRTPLKFGTETLTRVLCARVRMTVESRDGRWSAGWGETPLSVPWVWPSGLSYREREEALAQFAGLAAAALAACGDWGHPLELGRRFLEGGLPAAWEEFNRSRPNREPMPWLAALVCASPSDLALHDAYGVRLGLPTYATYGRDFLSQDLGEFLEPADDGGRGAFRGKYPSEYLVPKPNHRLRAWHLVGGLDPLTEGDAGPEAPRDGHPVALDAWIRRDGLKALKVKLRGIDYAWDLERLKSVAELSIPLGVEQFTADFNCTVRDPAYVCDMLDRLAAEAPDLYARLAYIEQPFEYDLEQRRLDVREISRRKPLFMDESAHGWREIRLGRSLGWTGVALKTCKTQTGALLSACWAREHGMPLMVQDLTNPMLAMIPHALLAAHVGTIAGLETNACQFYPAASDAEAALYPDVYRRRDGNIDLSAVEMRGLGVAAAAALRDPPPPVMTAGRGPA